MVDVSVQEKTILVVEDSADLNRLFVKHLRGRGFDVEGKHTVAEAAVHLESYEAPDLIILDLELTDGSGTDVLKMLHKSKFSNTKIVVVSGKAYSSGNNLHHYKIDYALMKPVSPRGLTALVKTLI